MTDRDNEINGICLRGKAGWGEGGAFITAMSNSFGARWFDDGLERPVRPAEALGQHAGTSSKA